MTQYDYDYEYNRAYTPSAPFVDIVVSTGIGTVFVELFAQIDTGADATAVPLAILEQLGALHAYTLSMVGINGISKIVDLYDVTVQIAGRTMGLEVVALTHGNETIIGRDILNYFAITLDGPGLTTIIPTE